MNPSLEELVARVLDRLVEALTEIDDHLATEDD